MKKIKMKTRDDCDASYAHLFKKRLWLLSALIMFSVGAFTQTRYPRTNIYSPITVSVADNIRAIVAVGATKGRHVNRYMRIGTSISTDIMGAFAHPYIQDGENDNTRYRIRLSDKAYLQNLINYFRVDTVPDPSSLSGDAAIARVAGATTSFDRRSYSTKVGSGAIYSVTGNPCPARLEINALSPGFAVIEVGANDFGGWGDFYYNIKNYMDALAKICDTLTAEGVVPLFRSACPKSTAMGANGMFAKDMEQSRAGSYLCRAFCQQRKLPFTDQFRTFMQLPNWGLGSDFLHPSTSGWLMEDANFSSEYLQYGYTTQNLLILNSLYRVYQIIGLGNSYLDAAPPALVGTGTQADPFIIDEWPFIDARATSSTNPEYYYKLVITSSIAFRGLATYQKQGVSCHFSLYDNAMNLLQTDGYSSDFQIYNPIVSRTIPAGTYYVKVSAKDNGYGEYQMLVQDSLYADTDFTNVPVTGVSVSPTSATLTVGSTQQLKEEVLPTDATNKNVTWSTSNAGVATVSTSGLVTAVAPGTATITVTTLDGNKTASSGITVNSSGPPANVTLAELNNIGTRAFIWGHHSIGDNIVNGFQRIIDANPGCGVSLKINPGSNFENSDVMVGRICHWDPGLNGNPASKLADFDSKLRGGVGAILNATGGIAILKINGTDFWPNNSTEIQSVQDAIDFFHGNGHWAGHGYKETIDALQALYPNVTFIHTTVPILWGIYGELNQKSTALSDEFKAHYPANRVMDLAEWQCLEPDGVTRTTDTWNHPPMLDQAGNPVRVMYEGWGSDGTHMNASGEDWCAKYFIHFLNNVVNSLSETQIPTVPTNLSTSVIGSSQINVSWYPSNGATGYDLEIDGTSINMGTNTTYSHTGLIAGSTHLYSVRAKNTAGSSAWSNQVFATVPL